MFITTNWFQIFHPLKIYILISLIIFLIKFKKKDETELQIVVILFLAVIHESITSYFFYIQKPISYITSIYICINFILWIKLLIKVFHLKDMTILLIFYSSFVLINLLFFEGIESFNYNSFLLGTIIYVGLFAYQNYRLIKNENFELFKTKNYLYLTSPILLFIGLSLMLAFKNKSLNSIEIFKNVSLYMLICYFVNFICYSLIILIKINNNKKT